MMEGRRQCGCCRPAKGAGGARAVARRRVGAVCGARIRAGIEHGVELEHAVELEHGVELDVFYAGAAIERAIEQAVDALCGRSNSCVGAMLCTPELAGTTHGLSGAGAGAARPEARGRAGRLPAARAAENKGRGAGFILSRRRAGQCLARGSGAGHERADETSKVSDKAGAFELERLDVLGPGMETAR